MITITPSLAAKSLPFRPDDAHKGTMGTLCSITGSYGYCGAAVLSAKAALRSGVGLHYQILPKSIYPIFASEVHESVCVPVEGSYVGTVSHTDIPRIMNTLERATAILIGCGMGNTPDTRAVLEEIIRISRIPIVIDADGINALALNIDILEELRAPIILTPHIKEFSRLTGDDITAIAADTANAADRFARRYPGVILALKNHRTVVAGDGELYLNTTGNSGMAKGGSGDVLAGVIASLAAQGVPALHAAYTGVYIHSAAGDIAAEELGKTSMLPTDITEYLGRCFSSLEALRDR